VVRAVGGWSPTWYRDPSQEICAPSPVVNAASAAWVSCTAKRVASRRSTSPDPPPNRSDMAPAITATRTRTTSTSTKLTPDCGLRAMA